MEPPCYCKGRIDGGHHTIYGCHSDADGPMKDCVHCVIFGLRADKASLSAEVAALRGCLESLTRYAVDMVDGIDGTPEDRDALERDFEEAVAEARQALASGPRPSGG